MPWKARRGMPQEFVGFWLNHHYSCRFGRVQIAKLKETDADLAAAIACEFGVPQGHIQCRMVYRWHGFPEEKCTEGKEYTVFDLVDRFGDIFNVFEDDHHTYPNPYFLEVRDDSGNTINDLEIEVDDEGEDQQGREEGKKEYAAVFGHKYRRVVVVGGAKETTATDEVGCYAYLFFHVKYLKEYLLRRRNSTRNSRQ